MRYEVKTSVSQITIAGFDTELEAVLWLFANGYTPEGNGNSWQHPDDSEYPKFVYLTNQGMHTIAGLRDVRTLSATINACK